MKTADAGKFISLAAGHFITKLPYFGWDTQITTTTLIHGTARGFVTYCMKQSSS